MERAWSCLTVYLSVSLPACLSPCLLACLPVSLPASLPDCSPACLPACLSGCLPAWLHSNHLSICLAKPLSVLCINLCFVFLSDCSTVFLIGLSICQSVLLFILPSIWLPTCLFTCHSISLSVPLFVHLCANTREHKLKWKAQYTWPPHYGSLFL